MNNYQSIGFTLYHSFIHQHEVKVTEPNKVKRTLLSKFIYTIIPKLTSEIVLNPFMIKYRKSYKKGVHTVRSVQPFYKILLTLFFSSILLSLFVCLYPPIQGEPAFMMFYTPIFFVYYFIFAVPLQLLFSLQPKAFHPLYLAAYLLIAMIVMLFVMDGMESSTSLPIMIVSSLIYWTCDSFIHQRSIKKTPNV